MDTSYKTVGMLHVKKLAFFQHFYENEQASANIFLKNKRNGNAKLRQVKA
jgi:hypothetical protein